MADYKDYIVRYDIIADVTKAAEGLQSIANIAKEFEGPMNTLKTAITQVSQSVYQLKQNSQMTFAPKIDVGAFNNQLRAMVTQVRSAAAEMHTAIFEALSGNAAATKAAQKGIGSALGGTRSVAAIKKDIEDYNKELDKLLGTPKKNKKGDTVRNRDGAIQMTKNALAKGSAQIQQQMQEKLLKLESQKRMFQNLIQQRKAELAVAEKLEKETAAQQAKAAKAQSKATAVPASKPTSSPQPAKLTNVTPAVIREWKKAFGDAKSKALTVNIRGNATGAGGALTVIEQIQASLRALQSQGTFNINPILNTEGFAAAEAKLRQLAGLSAAVVAPFTPKDTKAKAGKSSSLVSTLTKDEKTKLTNAQKQIKAWNEKIAPIQSRLNANKAIPEDQRTPAIKGQITRDTKTLAQYQTNKAEQENIVRSLQGKSTAAVQAAAKTAKPFALDIVGNLSKINVTAKPPVVQVVGEISKLQGKVAEAIPVNVKIMADQVAASVKSIPAPTLDVRVHLLTDGIQQQIQSLAGQSKPVIKTAPKTAPASATPAAQAHPVYTPPVFTAADEKQLNNLAAKYGTLSTAQEKAAKAMASAKAKLDKSGGSNRAFDRYMTTQREYGGIRKEYLDVQKQLKPLMFKQFQSTAQRALTDEEIVKGIGAQNIVNQLAAKKRLSAAQKTQLAEANQTLTALRAPATPPATPAPTAAVSQPTTTTQPPKAKKATGKNVITTTVDTKNIISQIQSIPKQTIPVSIKLMWEKGAVGRQEQIKRLAGNIPPITLNVDTTGAIAKLEEFIAKVRAASPQNIKLTATGAVTNTAPATTTPTTQKTPAATTASAKAKKPTVVGQKKPVIADPTKSLAQTKPQSVALKLDTTAAVVALEEFIAKVRAASPQNIKLTATGTPTNTPQNAATPTAPVTAPVAPIVPPVTGGSTQKSSKQTGHTGHQPLTGREKYDKLKTQSEDRARKQLADNRFRAAKRQEYNTQQQTWYNQQQALYNKLFGAASKPDPNWAYRQEQQRAAELTKMREDARVAFAKPTPFEQREAATHQAAVAQSIAQHQRQAEALRAKAQNAMLPFAQNKEQLNMLTKHRRFFRQAVTSTGIMPTPGMEAPQMLKYLQGVSTQMQQASVAVPWQLQSQINKLEGDVAKSKGIGESTVTRRSGMAPMPMRQKPFFDRTRRWAYPFTGQTSFGVRTPMAVDMAKGMGVMFAIGGAMSAIGSSFSQAMEYQNTMRTTQAILQNGTDSYSQNSFKNMEETVRNVGVKTKFSAPEVASAARFLAMAGYDIDAINAAIRPIADLALIGDSDLGETADKMTNIMTTFQIAPERMREAANIMATTATRSNTDLMMLAESAKYGGGVANMYGRNDPNLFADTMALFGVMGNAGIQASSAGTALRMMYQNLFKPNKNQKAVLDMMKQSYGITTVKDDGSYRSMSDILIEMAQRIPENQMAQIVGNLFRITAQPGAAATLLAAAGGDKGIAQEIGTGIEAVSSKMSSKAGLSSLISLMLANRNSANGNISGAIAEEKQNTISGLWSQVTSTFTEGIVQAFENRQGGFEDILRKLRNYLAKPETIQMMQNLLDMIIEIGKVMAWFVKIWASLYNAAPGLIKFWITFQMGITQMGTLIAPVVALIGVFDRLKGAIMALAGISAVGGGAVTRNVAGRVVAGGAASTVLANAPFIVGSGKFGTNKVIRGNIATRAHNAMAANAILAGELALSGANKQSTLATLNKETRQHYAAVRERAVRMYGPARAGRAFRAAATAIPTMASFAPIFGGLKSMLMGLLTGLAKAAGFLINPVTLATTALVGMGYGMYKIVQYSNGTTEAQIQRRKHLNQVMDKGVVKMKQGVRWHEDMNADNIISINALPENNEHKKKIEEYNAAKNSFTQRFSWLFEDFSKNASPQSINDLSNKWTDLINSNSIFGLALGDHKEQFTGFNLRLPKTPEQQRAIRNRYYGHNGFVDTTTPTAQNLQQNMIEGALMIEAAYDARVQQAVQQITDLYKTKDKYSESEYISKITDIRANLEQAFPVSRPITGLTREQYSQTSDRSIYAPYQQGALNIVDAYINQLPNTVVGVLEGQQTLAQKLFTTQDEWYNALSKIIGNYRVYDNFISADGQHQANLGVVLNMLPDKTIDFSSVRRQIEEKIGKFNLSLQQYMRLIGSFYAAVDGIDLSNPYGLKKQLMRDMNAAEFNENTVREYYRTHIANNSNNHFWKSGWTEDEFTKFAMSEDKVSSGLFGLWKKNNTRTVESSGQTISPSQVKTMIKKDIVNEGVKSIIDNAEKIKTSVPDNTSTTTMSTTSPTATTAKDQQAYASHYDRSAVRPTQVVFNINSLASFDRTTVASSAEERDLIAAMEDRIAGAVYQMFAEASNQAQRVMDLT